MVYMCIYIFPIIYVPRLEQIPSASGRRKGNCVHMCMHRELVRLCLDVLAQDLDLRDGPPTLPCTFPLWGFLGEIYYGNVFLSSPEPLSPFPRIGGLPPPKPTHSSWGGFAPPDPRNGGLRAAIKSARFAAHFTSIFGSSFGCPSRKIYFRNTHPLASVIFRTLGNWPQDLDLQNGPPCLHLCCQAPHYTYMYRNYPSAGPSMVFSCLPLCRCAELCFASFALCGFGVCGGGGRDICWTDFLDGVRLRWV